MSSAAGKRRNANRRGHWAEWRAALALMFKGYRIVALRHKTKLGEIDIIARRKDVVAIVEVKARPTVMAAVDAVTHASQRRIYNAADLWLARQQDATELSLRFDIMAVCPWRWPVLLENAF